MLDDELDLRLALERKVAQLERERLLHSKQLEWIAPTLGSSWVNWGGGGNFASAGYAIDGRGIVYLRGVIQNGTNGVIWTMPAAFRPVHTQLFGAITNGGMGRIDVSPAGDVTAITSSAAYLSLDGLLYDVAS